MTRERPILFSSPMVRAILNGRKTMTRRIVKAHSIKFKTAEMPFAQTWPRGTGENDSAHWDGVDYRPDPSGVAIHCPYGVPGDRLWVRESFALVNPKAGCEFNGRPDGDGVRYRSTWEKAHHGGWKPSIHMPRWASRLVLEITGARVERLQSVSRGDCMEEGCPFPNVAKETDPVKWFSELWCEINGPESWNSNVWVWVVSFRRIEGAK